MYKLLNMYYLTALFYWIWNDNSFALQVADCVELRLPPFLHPMMYQSVPTVWTPRPSPEIAAINILDDLPIVFINNDEELSFFKSDQWNLEKVHHLEEKVFEKGLDPSQSI